MLSTKREGWIRAFKSSESRKYLFGYRPTKIAFILLSSVGKGLKVLDLGCGSGRNSLFLAKHGLDVFSIDFIPQALKEVKINSRKEKVKVKICLADISEGIPLKANSFDAVLINVVLDSLCDEQRKAVVSEVHRILKKGGEVFVYEPSIKDEYYRSFLRRDEREFVCPDDGIRRNLFREEDLLEDFKKFKLVGIKENFPTGVMFGKKFRRAFLLAVFKKIQKDLFETTIKKYGKKCFVHNSSGEF